MSNQMLGSIVFSKVVGGPLPAAGSGPEVCDQPLQDPILFGRVLAAAVDRFDLITKLDELWNSDVAFGRLAYDQADEDAIADLYRGWLATAEGLAVELEVQQRDGQSFSHAEPFLVQLQETRGICTPDEVFFSGPQFEALRDRAVEAFHAGETVEFRVFGE